MDCEDCGDEIPEEDESFSYKGRELCLDCYEKAKKAEKDKKPEDN